MTVFVIGDDDGVIGETYPVFTKSSATKTKCLAS